MLQLLAFVFVFLLSVKPSAGAECDIVVYLINEEKLYENTGISEDAPIIFDVQCSTKTKTLEEVSFIIPHVPKIENLQITTKSNIPERMFSIENPSPWRHIIRFTPIVNGEIKIRFSGKVQVFPGKNIH